MKTILTLGLSILATSASAQNPLRDHDAYRDYLEAKHLRGDDADARRKAAVLADRLPTGSALHHQLRTETRGDTARAPDPAEVKYASGRKTEVYCRGKGLVSAEGQHDDGSFSKLLLISADRRMNEGAYALVGGGSQWIYELSNSFRKPVRSELWQSRGEVDQFGIIEVRRLPNGGFDQGSWESDWNAEGISTHYSINGEDVEPVRSMFMALQYHMWGSPKLGTDLRFEQGSRDTVEFKEQGAVSGQFELKADREVTEHLPTYSYTDAQGGAHDFNDCWKVSLTIAVP